MSALVIADGEGRMENMVSFKEQQTHGAIWAAGHYPNVYHGEASLPAKLATINNGFGDIMTSVHTENIAAGVQPEVATLCKVHMFTAPTSHKGHYLTVWGQYYAGGVAYDDVLMDAITSKISINMGSSDDALLTCVADFVGSHVEDSDGDDFSGTSWSSAIGAVVNLAVGDQCKQLRRQGAFLMVGNTAAEINSRFSDISIEMDFNVDSNDPAFKPAGRVYAREPCIGKDCSLVVTLTGDVSSPEDFRWPWGSSSSGSSPDDTYAAQQPCPAYVPVTLGCWGPSIEKVIAAAATEVSVTGEPTNIPTPAGTYTGTTNIRYEIIVTTVGTLDPDSPGEFKWRAVTVDDYGNETNGDWTETVSMDSDPITLSNGVTVSWTATAEGCTIDDEYSFFACNNRHGIILTIPYAQITKVAKKRGSARLGSEWEIKAFAPPGTAPYTLALWNTLVTAYDA